VTYSEGRLTLPVGCISGGHYVETKDKGIQFLCLFSRGSPDEMNRFKSFAAEAGALMVAFPPAWATTTFQPGNPVTNWIGALMFVESLRAGFITDRPGGCRVIDQLWAMSLAALRDWGFLDVTPKKLQRAGGRKRLEVSNPLLFQVYDRIRREHQPKEEYAGIVSRLKADKDFAQQVQEAHQKLDTKLVRNAITFFDERKRNAARKKQ
jgi:hypothetical protein